MSIGPLHVLVIGFDHPSFTGAALAELGKLEGNDVVRLVDLLFVEKDDAGNVTAIEVEDLDAERAAVFGDIAGALVGLGGDLDGDGVPDNVDDELWDIAEDLPPGSAAAIVLLEHHWAIGLRDALAAAGGQLLDDELIPSEDVAALGAGFEAAVRGRVNG
jgi:uncharacterized membrane protein